MDGFSDELAIIEHCDRISDPLERLRERQRLMGELHRQRAAIAKRAAIARVGEEEDEDADEAEAFASLADSAAELLPESAEGAWAWIGRFADHSDQLADTFPEGSAIQRQLRNNARQLRARSAKRAATAPTVTRPAPSRTAPRARARRERHVARATSSSDSGSDGEPPLDRFARFVRAIRRAWGQA